MRELKDKPQMKFWNQFIQDGDRDALSQIYFLYYDFLFDYGLKHTSDKQVVEDVIQETFVSMIRHRKSIGIVRNLSGYLITTFRNQLFLDLKKQRKTILTEQMPEEQFDYFREPDQDITDKENLEQLYLTIRQCIAKLTSRQQEIIFLRFEREISYEEIANVMNISVDSCYKSVHRAIKTVRSEAEKILGSRTDIILWAWLRTIKNTI